MRGHITKRGSGYSVVIYLGRDAEGKKKQKRYSGFRTKKEAEAFLSEKITEVDKGIFFEPEKQTFGEYLKKWLETHSINLAPRTQTRYKQIINQHLIPTLGYIPLSNIRPQHLQNLYSEKIASGLSPSTVLYIHRVVHKALKQAVLWQNIYTNPADAVQPPKRQKKALSIPSIADINALLDTDNEILNLAIFIAINTGMRRGEICGLKWADWQENKLTIQRALQRINGVLTDKPTKTEKPRVITLSPGCIERLKQERKKQIEQCLMFGKQFNSDGYILSWPDGRPVDPDYITKQFDKHTKRLGLDIRFHDLRHGHATMLLEAGINPKAIAERLGHSDIRLTLDIYSHVTPNIQKEIADKLDFLLSSKPGMTKR